MKFFGCILLFLWISITSQAQINDHIVISGSVFNKEKKEPLEFATIGIIGTSIGVASNVNGEFSINVPGANRNDTLMVSMLGYHRFVSPINKLSNNLHIELEERIYELDEVLVKAKNESLTADEIVKQVKKNEKSNLPDKDHSLSTFFRETYQLDGNYFRLLEAAATIYSKGYPRDKKDVSIDEIRLAPGKNPELPLSIGDNYNPFRELQATTGKIAMMKACQDCSFEIEEYTTNDEGLAVIISSRYASEDSTSQRTFTYTIDLTDYAVLQFDFETVVPFGIGFPETLENTYNSSLVNLKRRSDYQKYNGKYYLNKYHQHVKHAYRAINSDKNYTSEHQFYLITNNINENSEYKADELMDYRSNLDANLKEYNKAFWENYNVLKQTPLDKKIISDLEKNNN